MRIAGLRVILGAAEACNPPDSSYYDCLLSFCFCPCTGGGARQRWHLYLKGSQTAPEVFPEGTIKPPRSYPGRGRPHPPKATPTLNKQHHLLQAPTKWKATTNTWPFIFLKGTKAYPGGPPGQTKRDQKSQSQNMALASLQRATFRRKRRSKKPGEVEKCHKQATIGPPAEIAP